MSSIQQMKTEYNSLIEQAKTELFRRVDDPSQWEFRYGYSYTSRESNEASLRTIDGKFFLRLDHTEVWVTIKDTLVYEEKLFEVKPFFFFWRRAYKKPASDFLKKVLAVKSYLEDRGEEAAMQQNLQEKCAELKVNLS